MNIRDKVRFEIQAGTNARLLSSQGRAGVLFGDTQQFIPIDDLGYTSRVGFYQISLNPGSVSECTNENPETIHRYDTSDDWPAYIWYDSGGFGHLLGERWQVADLYQALGAYLHQGILDPEAIKEGDPQLPGVVGIEWAVAEYILHGLGDFERQAADTIRKAARDGRIPGAARRAGRWYFHQRKFRAWCQDAGAHKPGRTA